MQKISILLPTTFHLCTYFTPTALAFGTFVKIPFARGEKIGVVWDAPVDTTFPDSKIKTVLGVLDIPPLSKETCDFVTWVAGYTLSQLGSVLRMSLPVEDVDKPSQNPRTFLLPQLRPSQMAFSPEQTLAIKALTKLEGFSVTLLEGVTGSGKTEVYFEAIATALKKGKQVLVLLPEITLTGAWLKRFEARFGVLPACWHSDLSPKVRKDTWRAIVSGEARVVVGARSALFLSYQNLGLIIVDEEHDASYKQEEGVVYQARDMAVVRGQIGHFPVILASATPSLETQSNVEMGRYGHVCLPYRAASAQMPDIQVIDMREQAKSQSCLSPKLIQAVAQNLSQKNQTLLFLNRRGYAPIVLCQKCGEKLLCPYCSVMLTEHKRTGKLVCHQCGYTTKRPTVCPSCGTNDGFISCGIGVEKVQEEVTALFPSARVRVVTSDTMTTHNQFEQFMTDLENHQIDILIGTQMLAKGHNFADLTLVGVIDADFGLAGGDLRAAERTFQLMQQVSGRAGRSVKKGIAYIQTYAPDAPVMQALASGNCDDFMMAEKQSRKVLSMPPFGRLAAVIISGKKEGPTADTAQALIRKIPTMAGVEFLGPVQAPIYRLRGKYRYRILIKAGKKVALQKIIAKWLGLVHAPSTVQIKVDIDPYSFF